MLQTLEKKITEWKLKVGEYKHQMLALKAKSEQKKIALKKTVRFQKERAQHFEAAVENLTSRIRERVSDYAVSKVVLYCFKLHDQETLACRKQEKLVGCSVFVCLLLFCSLIKKKVALSEI